MSIGLKPSNGGSLTLQSFAGAGLGELRPEGSVASLMAEGAMAVWGFGEVELVTEGLDHGALSGGGVSLLLARRMLELRAWQLFKRQAPRTHGGGPSAISASPSASRSSYGVHNRHMKAGLNNHISLVLGIPV